MACKTTGTTSTRTKRATNTATKRATTTGTTSVRRTGSSPKSMQTPSRDAKIAKSAKSVAKGAVSSIVPTVVKPSTTAKMAKAVKTASVNNNTTQKSSPKSMSAQKFTRTKDTLGMTRTKTKIK